MKNRTENWKNHEGSRKGNQRTATIERKIEEGRKQIDDERERVEQRSKDQVEGEKHFERSGINTQIR